MRDIIKHYNQFKEHFRNQGSIYLPIYMSIEMSNRPYIFEVICFSEQKLFAYLLDKN